MPSADLSVVAGSLRRLGGIVTDHLERLGCAARFFVAIVANTPSAFRRLHLTLREIYFSGVLSLVIILISGLFVGMVLALQGFDVLQRYGADQSLGVLVALSLVRELGPVVAGLLFASRAGSAITAEIGLMKATEQLAAMEMMAVDPLARVVAPRFWGGVISMPLLAALFSTLGVFGAYIVGERIAGGGYGIVLGAGTGAAGRARAQPVAGGPDRTRSGLTGLGMAPPYRRSRWAYSSQPYHRCRRSNSGHSVSSDTNSAYAACQIR